MDDAAIEKWRDRLLDLQTELAGQVAAPDEATDTVELDQCKVGRLSRMDALQGQQMALELARRRREQLARVGGALRRIEAGDYGYCFRCGEEIDGRRLAFDPTTTRCVACSDA